MLEALTPKLTLCLIMVNTDVREKIGIDFYVLFLITIPLCAATLCMALQNISLGALLPVTSANLLLLFHTIVGQSSLDETSDMFTSAYFTPWHLFDKTNRRLLLIFMMNTRNGVALKKGNASLELSSFANQLKICFTAGLTLYQAFSEVLQK
nr:unnamed protein product [Callosobruchus chinensis]